MTDFCNPNAGDDAFPVDRVVPSPELVAIVAEAGLSVDVLNPGKVRVWRSFAEDGESAPRIAFAALTVNQFATCVRFHVIYNDNDEVRVTFSPTGCLLKIESGDLGLVVEQTMQTLIETLLVDFRWAVCNLPSVH